MRLRGGRFRFDLGFISTSALPYFGAEVPGITEFYSAGAHSDIGGSQPQYERTEEYSSGLRNDNLQDINLAVMREMAQRSGVELSDSAAQDQFRIDPRLLSEKQLWWNKFTIHASTRQPTKRPRFCVGRGVLSRDMVTHLNRWIGANVIFISPTVRMKPLILCS